MRKGREAEHELKEPSELTILVMMVSLHRVKIRVTSRIISSLADGGRNSGPKITRIRRAGELHRSILLDR